MLSGVNAILARLYAAAKTKKGQHQGDYGPPFASGPKRL
ncbi:Hypothetical protein ABZS17G119_00141 [Kosakonia cowanii]